MVRANNVRGPTSALTEFLRESGITPRTVARRVRTQTQDLAAQAAINRAGGHQGEASGSGSNAQAEGGEGDEVTSDHLDSDAEEEKESPSKKRKLTKAAQAKAKAAEEKKAKGKKGKGKGKDDDDEYSDEEDEEEDAYTALSKSMYRSTGPKPPAGSFEDCAKCKKQFTVTKYTMAADPPPGWLCHACSKAAGRDPFKKPAAPRKRKAPADKRKFISFEETRRLPTLAHMCINIIGKHINDVEALGDIGSLSLNEIGRVIAKNRSLNEANVQLFYDASNSELTLYDVTNLTPPAFQTLASLNPGLQKLRLDFCGRLDCSAVNHWSENFPSLTYIDLLGPFLVRKETWPKFFAAHPTLEGFLLTQSPRFDLNCMRSLAENCANLSTLRLREIGLLDRSFLEIIATMKGLKSLEIAYPSSHLEDDSMIELIHNVAPRLTHLNLSGHENLSGVVMRELSKNAGKLESIILNDLPSIEDADIAAMFDAWTPGRPTRNPPLQRIEMARNPTLGSGALDALLAQSGSTLVHLNINGWKDAAEETLRSIGEHSPNLQKLDVSWCRAVDNFVIKDVLEDCEGLAEIKLYGCNRITIDCPRKRGVAMYGVESNTNSS